MVLDFHSFFHIFFNIWIQAKPKVGLNELDVDVAGKYCQHLFLERRKKLSQKGTIHRNSSGLSNNYRAKSTQTSNTVCVCVCVLGVARYTDVTVRYVPQFGGHGSIRFRYNRKKKNSTMLGFFSFIFNRQLYKLLFFPPRCENTKYYYIMLYIYIYIYIHKRNKFFKYIWFSLQINKGKKLCDT